MSGPGGPRSGKMDPSLGLDGNQCMEVGVCIPIGSNGWLVSTF